MCSLAGHFLFAIPVVDIFNLISLPYFESTIYCISIVLPATPHFYSYASF